MEYENLTDKQKKKLGRRLTLEDNANLALLEELEDINENMEEMKSKETPESFKVEIQGAEILTIKGEKGDKGDKGDMPSKDELTKIILPLIPKPIEGKQGPKGDKGAVGPAGRDGINGKDGESIVGPKGEDGKDGSPDTPEQIVQKINSLPIDDDDLKIDSIHVKGFERIDKIEKDLVTIGQRPNAGSGITGKDFIRPIDISSQLDGIKKTFNIQAIYYPISVSLSSYPYASLRAGIDYTWTPTSITFTSEIDAETQLASGQKCIILAVL